MKLGFCCGSRKPPRFLAHGPRPPAPATPSANHGPRPELEGPRTTRHGPSPSSKYLGKLAELDPVPGQTHRGPRATLEGRRAAAHAPRITGRESIPRAPPHEPRPTGRGQVRPGPEIEADNGRPTRPSSSSSTGNRGPRMNTRRTEKAAETRPRREHDAPLETKTAPNGAASALDIELDY